MSVRYLECTWMFQNNYINDNEKSLNSYKWYHTIHIGKLIINTISKIIISTLSFLSKNLIQNSIQHITLKKILAVIVTGRNYKLFGGYRQWFSFTYYNSQHKLILIYWEPFILTFTMEMLLHNFTVSIYDSNTIIIGL